MAEFFDEDRAYTLIESVESDLSTTLDRFELATGLLDEHLLAVIHEQFRSGAIEPQSLEKLSTLTSEARERFGDFVRMVISDGVYGGLDNHNVNLIAMTLYNDDKSRVEMLSQAFAGLDSEGPIEAFDLGDLRVSVEQGLYLDVTEGDSSYSYTTDVYTGALDLNIRAIIPQANHLMGPQQAS